MERKLWNRQIRIGRLLVIEVRLPRPAGHYIDLVLADGTGRAEARDGRAVRTRRRDVAGLLVVPVHHPGALHRPPAEAVDAKLDGRADRPFLRRHLEGLCHFDAALRDRRLAVADENLVDAAEVFGDGEARLQRAVRVAGDLRERALGLVVLLAAEVEVVLDHPAAVDGAPHEVERLVRGKTFGRRVDSGTDNGLGSFRSVVGECERFRRICRVRKDPALATRRPGLFRPGRLSRALARRSRERDDERDAECCGGAHQVPLSCSTGCRRRSSAARLRRRTA